MTGVFQIQRAWIQLILWSTSYLLHYMCWQLIDSSTWNNRYIALVMTLPISRHNGTGHYCCIHLRRTICLCNISSNYHLVKFPSHACHFGREYIFQVQDGFCNIVMLLLPENLNHKVLIDR